MKREYRIIPVSQAGRFCIQVRTLKGAVKSKWETLPTIYSSELSAQEAIKRFPYATLASELGGDSLFPTLGKAGKVYNIHHNSGDEEIFNAFVHIP